MQRVIGSYGVGTAGLDRARDLPKVCVPECVDQHQRQHRTDPAEPDSVYERRHPHLRACTNACEICMRDDQIS